MSLSGAPVTRFFYFCSKNAIFDNLACLGRFFPNFFAITHAEQHSDNHHRANREFFHDFLHYSLRRLSYSRRPPHRRDRDGDRVEMLIPQLLSRFPAKKWGKLSENIEKSKSFNHVWCAYGAEM